MSRVRILIVDDEAHVRFVLEHALRAMDDEYEIATAASGHEALELMAQEPIDLLVTDIRIPKPDGIELTVQFRARAPVAPVIWITAHGNGRIRRRARELGIFRYMEKPLEISELRQVVRRALTTAGSAKP
ncbi:MAG: response regulator [Anaerolineae bacterium]|nr:response regulator [Anaerolineae bacterium]